VLPKKGRDTAQLVTEARKPRSEDIAYRERRYLIMSRPAPGVSGHTNRTCRNVTHPPGATSPAQASRVTITPPARAKNETPGTYSGTVPGCFFSGVHAA